MNSTMIAPGWYLDGSYVRCWDGGAWGPYAPAPGSLGPPQTEEEKGKNRYTRCHAAESLNFQISFGIAYLTAFILTFVTMFASFDTDPNAAPRGPVFIFFLLIFIAMIAMNGLSMMGMVKANRGIYWRYPLSIRFVERQFLSEVRSDVARSRASAPESPAG